MQFSEKFEISTPIVFVNTFVFTLNFYWGLVVCGPIILEVCSKFKESNYWPRKEKKEFFIKIFAMETSQKK